MRLYILIAALISTGCTVQRKARVLTLDSGAICASSTPATLDEIWTQYLSGAPTSGRGGCASTGCHLDGAGGLQFSSAAQFAAATVNVSSLSEPTSKCIAPDNPGESVLFQRLLPMAGAGQMPFGGPYLQDADLLKVAGWICAGASSTSIPDGGVADAAPGGDTTPPVFNGATTATASPNSITLTWSAATDNVTPSAQITYLIYQATSSGGESYATPAYMTPPGAISFSVSKLPINATFYFVVRARDAAGNIDSNTKQVSATTPAISDTQAPTFAGASSATVAAQTITINWSPATDNVTAANQMVYLIYQATASGGESYTTPTYVTNAGATSYAVTGLIPGSTYYFVVRAQDQAGNIDTNTHEVSGTTSIVAFASQVQPIFTANCTGSACHSGARPAEGLDLSSASASYSKLVNVASTECTATKRVVPKSTSTSYLVWKLQGSGPCFFGSSMPKGLSLSSADLNTIIGWVAEGAPNN